MWKYNNSLVGFLQTFFLAFLFIIIEQQWNHLWSFQIWVMLCVIPYITNNLFNYSSNFNIFIAYDIDFVFVILFFWILVFPQSFPKVPMVFTSSSFNFWINFQSSQIIPKAPRSKSFSNLLYTCHFCIGL